MLGNSTTWRKYNLVRENVTPRHVVCHPPQSWKNKMTNRGLGVKFMCSVFHSQKQPQCCVLEEVAGHQKWSSHVSVFAMSLEEVLMFPTIQGRLRSELEIRSAQQGREACSRWVPRTTVHGDSLYQFPDTTGIEIVLPRE